MNGTSLTIRKQFSRALVQHRMLQRGDHVLVGLSGGKDSWALLGLLAEHRKRAPFSFQLSAVTIDGGLEGFDASVIERQCRRLDVPFHLVRQKIFETVADKKDEGSTFCSMCAKLRRGALYTAAERFGATKIALGHHLDDAIETLCLNLFYGGRMAALPPVLLSNAGHVPVIRPILYCEERWLAMYSHERQFPVVGCTCPVCPTHPEHEYSDLKRKRVKQLISVLAVEIPDLHASMRSALSRLEPSRFLDPRFSEKGTFAPSPGEEVVPIQLGEPR
ncbi:MAG TPA: ATP-binding protein [Bdellovibrionota bacterium]|nr:ATP-binding protein [Bdellovibrionota bacterium]